IFDPKNLHRFRPWMTAERYRVIVNDSDCAAPDDGHCLKIPCCIQQIPVQTIVATSEKLLEIIV
ncbi:hypothetical protein K8I28_00740, partial [bacterium]|nr:hypothetical protein [bacterium]